MPCCVDNCQRCAAHFGGFKFPWLGLWNSRGFVLPPDVAPNEAWDYYYQYRESMDFCWWRPTPTSLRHLTWSARSSTRFSSDAQRVTLGSWVWESFSTNGAHGCVHGQPRDPATFCRAAPLPKGSQGALASLGTRRSSSTSGALRLAGEP